MLPCRMFNHRSTKKDRVRTEQEEAVRFELGFEACIGVRGQAPLLEIKTFQEKKLMGRKTGRNGMFEE